VSNDVIAGDQRPLPTTVVVDGEPWLRRPVRTHWLSEQDDLAAMVDAYTTDRLPGDTIVVSEKVAVLLTGRSVSIDRVRVGEIARWLARFVRPRSDSRGLSVPAKMQYVLDDIGLPRLLVAAVVSALTRPLGLRGAFYRVAGPVARDLDGGRPPYEDRLFPPLRPADAEALCAELDDALGVGVAIIDMNDFGGSVRARSPRSIQDRELGRVVADNPLGQRMWGTPFALVRRGQDAPPVPVSYGSPVTTSAAVAGHPGGSGAP
jgi:hypothetical protein